MSSKNTLSIMAARNGWTVRTRSGVYICLTMRDLLKEVESYALVLKKEAENPQGSEA